MSLSALPRPAVPLPEACGCVLGAWFTFIFRTTGLRAVEDFIRGVLLTLVGHTLTSSVSWALLPIPHFCLDYSTPFGVCQAFFLNPLGLFSVPEAAAAGLIVGVHLGKGFFLGPVSLRGFPLGGVDFEVFKRHFSVPLSLGGFLPLSGIIITQPGPKCKLFLFVKLYKSGDPILLIFVEFFA